jgi:tellurite resistance protein
MQGPHRRAGSAPTALALRANLFAVAFGLAGLAQAWSLVTGVPGWPANVLWIIATAVWLMSLACYRRYCPRWRSR